MERQRRREQGLEVTSSSSSEGELRTDTWETRAEQRRQAREAAAEAKLPKLRKGRNIVREQLEARRARNRAAVDAAGIDRDSEAYLML